MQNKAREFPCWLSTAKPVVEPAISTQPLGVQRALISFSRASHQGLLEAFGLLETAPGPPLPGAVNLPGASAGASKWNRLCFANLYPAVPRGDS